MRTIRIPNQKTGPNGEKLCRWCEGPVPTGRRTFCSKECVHEAMLRSDPGYLRRQTHARDQGVCAACGRDTDAMKLRYLKVANIARAGINAYDRLRKAAAKRMGIQPGDPTDRLWKIFNCRDRREVEETHAKNAAREIANFEEIQARYNERGELFTRQHPNHFLPQRLQRDLASAIEMTDQDRHIQRIDTRLKRLALARRKRIAAEIEAEGFRGSADSQKLCNLWQADHIHPVQHGGGGCGLENIQTLCSPCHKRKTAEQARRAALIRRGIDPDTPPAPDPQLPLL